MKLLLNFAYWMISFVASITLFPSILYKGLFRDKSYMEYLGFYSDKSTRKSEKSIWVHCSSVGEVRIGIQLLKELKELASEKRYVLTVVTRTGRDVAKYLASEDIEVRHFPLDLKSTQKRGYKYFNPEKMVLIETELWPNCLRVAVKRNVDLYLANGRISDRSYATYLRIGSIFEMLLKKFRLFMMQSKADMERIVSLGAEKSKCKIIENIKYDLIKNQLRDVNPVKVRKNLGINKGDLFVIAGSTRADEEQLLLKEFVRLKQNHKDLKLIIAPRHLNRVSEAEYYIDEAKLKYIRRSELSESEKKAYDVIVLDTMGDLVSMYSIAQAAFVGGSLVPKGGQNPLEPVGLGVPTCFGPHMENFSEIASKLTSLNLAVSLQDSNQLKEFFENVLSGKINKPNPDKLFDKLGSPSRKTAEMILKN